MILFLCVVCLVFQVSAYSTAMASLDNEIYSAQAMEGTADGDDVSRSCNAGLCCAMTKRALLANVRNCVVLSTWSVYFNALFFLFSFPRQHLGNISGL